MMNDKEKIFEWIKINITTMWTMVLLVLVGYSFDMYLTGALICITMSIIVIWMYDSYPLNLLLHKLVEMEKKKKKSEDDGQSV